MNDRSSARRKSYQHPKVSPLFAVADSDVVEAGHGVGDPVTVKDGADRRRRRILFPEVINDVDIGGRVGPPLGTHDVCEREVSA